MAGEIDFFSDQPKVIPGETEPPFIELPLEILRGPPNVFGALLKGMGVDQKRAALNGCAALNRDRRARGQEPVTFEEYVAGRRK